MSATGKIILINGASSSGKTSLLRALQDQLVEPYLEAGIDKFIFMLPERYLERPLWDDVLGKAVRAGETGHRLVHGMHRAVAALSDAGLNVLVDHVLVERAWAQDCALWFAERCAVMVGVRCPLEVLEARERARKNRTLGQARDQFEVVHVHAQYDLEVDTGKHSAAECARQVAAWMASGELPRALQRMRQAFGG